MSEDRSITGSDPLHSRRRSVACGILTSVAFLSAVVLARRVSGDVAPLSERAGALIGVLAVGISGLCAIVPGVFRRRPAVADRLLTTGLVSIPGLVLGLALLPANSAAGLCAVIGAYTVSVFSGVMAGETVLKTGFGGAAAWTQPDHDGTDDIEALNRHIAGEDDHVESLRQNTSLAATDESTPTTEITDSWVETVPHPSENSETTQWMSRTGTPACETAEGGCQVEFGAQQKVVAVHIPFSPPFSVTPCFECEPLDGTELKIKISARYRYGVRFELTRQGNLAVARSVSLGWFAIAKADVMSERSAA